MYGVSASELSISAPCALSGGSCVIGNSRSLDITALRSMSVDARAVCEACKTTTLTFDCYGTLIDWHSGACRSLRDLYGYARHDAADDTLVDLFLDAEARIVRENVFPYAQVLQRVAQSVAESMRVRSNSSLEASFANSLPTWPVYKETNPSLTRLARQYRLGIISNVDDHLLSQTIRQFNAPIDFTVTSEQTGSYKPDRAIFDRAVDMIGEHPGRIIHIAEGLCEATPAHEVGMRSIWVRRSTRSDDGSNAQPDAIVSNLTQLVDAIS